MMVQYSASLLQMKVKTSIKVLPFSQIGGQFTNFTILVALSIWCVFGVFGDVGGGIR